jgi:hypothetical protein
MVCIQQVSGCPCRENEAKAYFSGLSFARFHPKSGQPLGTELPTGCNHNLLFIHLLASSLFPSPPAFLLFSFATFLFQTLHRVFCFCCPSVRPSYRSLPFVSLVHPPKTLLSTEVHLFTFLPKRNNHFLFPPFFFFFAQVLFLLALPLQLPTTSIPEKKWQTVYSQRPLLQQRQERPPSLNSSTRLQ